MTLFEYRNHAEDRWYADVLQIENKTFAGVCQGCHQKPEAWTPLSSAAAPSVFSASSHMNIICQIYGDNFPLSLIMNYTLRVERKILSFLNRTALTVRAGIAQSV